MKEPQGCRRFFLRGALLHPVWRAAIYLIGLLVAEFVLDLLVSILYIAALLLMGIPLEVALSDLSRGQLPGLLLLGVGVTRLLAALGLALLMGRFLDREPVETMGLERARLGRDAAWGMALGVGTMLLVGAIILALNPQPLRAGSATWWAFLLDAVALLPAAAAEEVAFRGYLQRLFTTWRGPIVGVLVPSIFFGLFHALNPNVSALALVNIALAGVVFALAVERTGTLWLAIVYHYAWNLTQGPVLGLPLSGMSWDGLLALPTGGPPLVTGGAFGPEGGLLSTAVLLLSLLPLWALTRRPATPAGVLRRQRAKVERRGALPYQHCHLRVGADFFNDFVLPSANRKHRMGEVVLLLRREDGHLLLHTKSFYPPDVFRLPSGGILPGESVLAAACREAREETGLEIDNPRPLGVVSVTFREGRRRRFFHSWLVLAHVEGDPRTGDPGERISDFRWVPPEKLAEVAEELRALPPEWADWGRFRALAHEAALRWLL
jgi:membrane protease YdiL (CAAX protease family)/8-oxo-dGTP pyrophosphatase MutT (NUDIX family)